MLSTTRQNFHFSEIHIFENYMSKQIPKFIKMNLFWKINILDKIVREDIYCARLAQLSTTFIFSKFTFFLILFFFKISKNNDKLFKKIIFIQSCICMAMQGCILMLRVRAQKSIETFLRSPKIARYSKVVFLSKIYFLKLKIAFQW